MLVNGADNVTEQELSLFFTQYIPSVTSSICEKLSHLVKEGVRVNIDTRDPVIMCLDKVTIHKYCMCMYACLCICSCMCVYRYMYVGVCMCACMDMCRYMCMYGWG